jgi:dolichyl-phosphate-mannose--protein O-mannosyl transferase
LRRALVLAALCVAAAAFLPRTLKISTIDTLISAQLAFAAMLFLCAWVAHWLKARKEDR